MKQGSPTPRWNITFGVDVLSPKTDAFLVDIEATCRDHAVILSHMAGAGLIVAPFEEALMARLRNAKSATSAALKVIGELESICRNHRLVLTHEEDKPWDLVPKEPSGRFVLAPWSEKLAVDLRHASIWDDVECFVYQGEPARDEGTERAKSARGVRKGTRGQAT